MFMDDFSVVGTSFDDCFKNLRLVLQRCEETNLILNGKISTSWCKKVLCRVIGF